MKEKKKKSSEGLPGAVAHGATSGSKEEEWLRFEVVRRKKRWASMGVFPLFFFSFFLLFCFFVMAVPSFFFIQSPRSLSLSTLCFFSLFVSSPVSISLLFSSFSKKAPLFYLWFSPCIYRRQGERVTLPCPSTGYSGRAWVFCFFHNGGRVWVVSGERVRESGQEKKILKKASSSPVAHPGEKEEQCCLKRHCFVFFF